MFKRLKNIENKVKGKNKKELEPTKNKKQLEVRKDEPTVADKKPTKIVLLKDKLDFISKNFGSNFNNTGKKYLIKLAKDEKKIDYNNLYFEIDDKSVVKSVDFLKENGTLYDLFIYLLDNSNRVLISAETQINFTKAITVLKIIISNIKTDIADQVKNKKRKFLQKKSVF